MMTTHGGLLLRPYYRRCDDIYTGKEINLESNEAASEKRLTLPLSDHFMMHQLISHCHLDLPTNPLMCVCVCAKQCHVHLCRNEHMNIRLPFSNRILTGRTSIGSKAIVQLLAKNGGKM